VKLLGILGVLLAIPSAAAIQIILREWWAAKGLVTPGLSADEGPTRCRARRALIDQSSGAARASQDHPHADDQAPIAPTTIGITLTVERRTPATWVVTANLSIAPTATTNKLNPMPIT
jgi:hypothetical protein